MPKASVYDLLPPYMGDQAWSDLAKSIDEVFGADVSPLIEGLGYLRHTYIADYGSPTIGHFLLNETVPGIVSRREMLGPEDFDAFDMQTERLRLSQDGLILSNPGLLDITGTPTLANSPTHRLTQNIGMYWYHKGWDQGTFIDFINYCLGTDVKLLPLWTTDYKSFFEEGDPVIGTPIWNGGAWYPTTHVRIDISTSNITTADLVKLVSLFYDIANYNLVLESVSKKEFHQIVDNANETGPIGWAPAEANLVKLGVFQETSEWVQSVDMCPLPAIVSALSPSSATIGVSYTGTFQVSSNATSLVSYTLPPGFTASLSGTTVTVTGLSNTVQTFNAYFNLENNCGTAPTSRADLYYGPFEIGGSAPGILTSILITTSAVAGDVLSVTRIPVFGGLPAPSVSYQWKLNGVDNGPATTVPDTRPASPGTWVCVATATNPLGSVTTTSNSTSVACALPIVVQELTPAVSTPGVPYLGTMILRNVTGATISGFPSWATISAPTISGSDYTYTLAGTQPAGSFGPNVVASPVITWNVDRFVVQQNAVFNGSPTPTIQSQAWMQNGAPVSGEVGATFTPVLGQSGGFQLRQLGSNGVGPDVYSSSNVITLGPPVTARNPAISVVGSTLSVTTGALFTSDLPLNPLGYTWIKDGFEIPGATGTSISPTSPGDYYAIARQANQVAVGSAASNHIVLTIPQITSTPYLQPSAPVGTLLTAQPPTTTGFPTPVLSPSWRLNGAPVSNESTYTPQSSGQLTIVWTSTNIAGSASAQTGICTVANQVCALPAVSSGLPWPNATTGTPYDHTVFVSDCTSSGTSIAGLPSWASVTYTQAGSGLNIRVTGTPTIGAIQGFAVQQNWSVRTTNQGTFQIYPNGTATHYPSGSAVSTNWNTIAPDENIGPQWVVRFSSPTPGSFSSASQGIFNTWRSLGSAQSITVPGGGPGTAINATLNVELSGDSGSTVAQTCTVGFTVFFNDNS